MQTNHAFRIKIQEESDNLVTRQQSALGAAPGDEILKIDLHCHDRNSDVPDETLGRILRLPETWLETDRLLKTLRENGADAFTVTNHNNARSCFELLDKGLDVLVGAEFSCTLPDLGAGVHVLTFGFAPSQEARLNGLRKNIYRFLEYAYAEDIVTVLAHPLHFYSPGGMPTQALMDRLGILFERFEGLNGQRDCWQNLLSSAWVEDMNEETIEAMAKRTGLRPDTFSSRPFLKRLSGGSDCHFGLFAGRTGTLVRVAGGRKPGQRTSEAVLKALRLGDMAPYGSSGGEDRLVVAFLDYFCQVALNMKDPGLLRMLLHRGSSQHKLLAFSIINAMMELRRHKYTSRFLNAFHESLQGKKPGVLDALMTSPPFRPILKEVERIAHTRRKAPGSLPEVLSEVIPSIFKRLIFILSERVGKKVHRLEREGVLAGNDPAELISRLEVPAHLRTLFGEIPRNDRQDLTPVHLGRLSDGLPFPALAAGVIGGAAFAGAKVLFAKRPFINDFARALGKFTHPRRVLWVTDTFLDRNGVSHALRTVHEEVKRRNLPIDFFICHVDTPEDAHLLSLPPAAEFTLPFYTQQSFRLPDLLELQRLFLSGAYDRIVCSTELLMGPMALYLKHAFNVPAYFYMHTDWLDFARRTLGFDTHMLDRLRRILRAYYGGFDGIFVLNSEHRDWLTSEEMNLPGERIHATAHWVAEPFHPRQVRPGEVFPGLAADAPVVLYAGRLSDEKGVMEIPGIFARIRAEVPGAHMVFAGSGPSEEKLRRALPEAQFLGWVDAARLPGLYSAAGLLLLPSRFDTFGCVVLEAMSCGTPVVAYNTKGPRDIIQSGVNGFLGEDAKDLARDALRLLKNPGFLSRMRLQARRRANAYRADRIMDQMLADLGLTGEDRLQPVKPAAARV